MDELIEVLKELAWQIKQLRNDFKQLKEAIWDLQQSQNIEPIVVEESKEPRQIPYKVVQYIEDPEMVWEDGAPRKIFQWFWNTFKSQEDAQEYYDRVSKANPWFKYDIFPV